MKIIKYDKLIRDRIPEIIEKSGKKAVVEELSSLEYKKYLDEKLGEELKEYLADDSLSELADMVEVIYAILKYKDVDMKSFEALRARKAEERGAFDRRLLLREVLEE